MTERVLIKGNEAIGEAAIRAGCRAYFGYPITPQTELLEYMSRRMPEEGRVFVQAESELAAISMVFGAATTGARAMTSSSGPGISLMQEGLSYVAGCELPAVVVNVQRAGPGLGGILVAQGDYLQATKGGGHGDYHLIVLAPNSVQEAMDLTALAFDLADRYRNPVMLLADAIIGQVKEPVILRDYVPRDVAKPWALTGAKGRKKNIIRSLFLDPLALEAHNRHLEEKYRAIAAEEVRYKELMAEDAEVVLVAYGTPSRVAQTVVKQARAEGMRVGLFRPVSLWPFPYARLEELARSARAFVVVELSQGQLIEDVRLATKDRVPIHLCNRLGGLVPSAEEVMAKVREAAESRGLTTAFGRG